jgi:ATP-dependent 26S proteasome regulatory subunit
MALAVGMVSSSSRQANDISALDPSLSTRPGRFDRVVYLGLPDQTLRLSYLQRLSVSDDVTANDLSGIAQEAEGFSFAQLTEVHVAAGNAAFVRSSGEDRIRREDLRAAVNLVRGEAEQVKAAGRRRAGFGRRGGIPT